MVFFINQKYIYSRKKVFKLTIEETKANPLSSLNKVFLFQRNRYYYLDMIAAAAAAAAEWNLLLVFELRSFDG